MRHLLGVGLAIGLILVMFFAGAWGYLRLLLRPEAGVLPAHGGSLLSSPSVLAALAAVAATGLVAGALVAAPRFSPLAAGLPGLLLLGWTGLYLVSVRKAVDLIPLRSHSFGAGWEALLYNGILGAVGLALIVPLFVPARWRGLALEDDSEEGEDDDDYIADLVKNREPRGGIRSLRRPRREDGSGPLPAVPARRDPLRAPGPSSTATGPRPATTGGLRPFPGDTPGGPRPSGDQAGRPSPYRAPLP